MLRKAVDEKNDTTNANIVITKSVNADIGSRWKNSFRERKKIAKPRATKIADIIMPMNMPNGMFIDKAIIRKPIDPGNSEYDTAVRP